MRNFHIISSKSGHLPTKGRLRRAGYADNKGYTISNTQAEALGWAGLQESVAWAVMDEYLKETYESIINYDATSFEILSVGVACN